MTSPHTIGYVATRLRLSEMWRFADKFGKDWPFAAALRDCMDQARSFGVEPQDIDGLVTGAELVVDQDPAGDSIAPAIFLEVSDREKFQRLIDSIIREKLPDSCRRTTISGSPAYILWANERASIVFGLVGRKLLMAINESVFAEMKRRLDTGVQGLQSNSQFREAESLVPPSNDLFLYIDTKAGFERFYSAVRPMLIFGAALLPAVDRYVDVMAFPEPSEITKHLSPIVLSRHRVEGGYVDESVGPVTAYEASALAFGSAVALGILQRK